jgi:hypothetical protein
VFGSSGCLWLGSAAAVGIGAWIALATLGLVLRPAAFPEILPTPILTVIFASTATPTPPPTPIPSQTVATPTLPAASGGTVRIGELVEVFGTGGDGLRLRAEPDLQSQILVLGVDSEVFQVDNGPVQEDGFEWWYLVNPYDTAKQGWAVALYFRPLSSP